MKVRLFKIGILCGIVAPLLWALVIIVSGSLRPEYSGFTQYISELGERGSSTELLMRYAGFVPTGLMHAAFAAVLYGVFRGNRLAAIAALLLAVNGLGRVGAGLFPCELGCTGPRILLSQKLHSISSGIGFLAIIASSLLWGIFLKFKPKLRWLGLFSIGSGILGLVFLLLMLSSAEARTATGLYERLSTGVLSLWVMLFAIRLWSVEAYKIDSRELYRPSSG